MKKNYKNVNDEIRKNSIKNISDIEISEVKVREEYPPYKCKMCGESVIENSQEICTVCGWQDCDILYRHPNCFGGPSILSFNQYKMVWENNKTIIKNKEFGKYCLVKQIFEENSIIYSDYCDEQIGFANNSKRAIQKKLLLKNLLEECIFTKK